MRSGRTPGGDVVTPCSRRSLKPDVGRFCSPNAAVDRGRGSNSLSLERSGSLSGGCGAKP